MVIVGPGFYPDSWGDKRHLFVREVMPALRQAFAPGKHRAAVPA